ncbi:glucose/mannose transport system substrate-binding protein [Paucibacter oligotrophus]|uniref:Probable sugar-binding periplasmic protein n=1 Tax=Roseateles oligotrophus TaxID=1769250 RepID=A0A840L9Z1_9BURK|nr:ABC transporter substrate-binding protein [Roseateles oligotrophus]MBB4842187.1 glucose/mannose transport system substrate-binding protein [Roseateles oligotrophus]
MSALAAIALGALSTPLASAAPAGAGEGNGELNVLHWWTSASERAAADHVAARMAEMGLRWVDGAVAGGGGGAAIKVLNERTLRRMGPKVAQLNGQSMSEWAGMGLLLELDGVAQRRGWARTMFPQVMEQVTVREHVVAAPMGIHRINNLYLNKAVFRRLKIELPSDWAGLEKAAAALRAAGVTPVAFSDEPWQVATVFEALLLGEAGPALYRRMMVQQDVQAFDDPALERAFKRLRAWRNLSLPSLANAGGQTVGERPWTELVADFAAERSAMLIMGDWARGELGSLGLEGGRDFDCKAVPGSAQAHLYSIDTLAMLAGNTASQADQEKMAELLGGAALQLGYNRIKGSVPVRRDVPVDELDMCAQQSFRLFANPGTPRVPSLVHRMAFGEVGKNAIIETVHRFALDPNQTPAAAQRKLQGLLRALSPKTNTSAKAASS